MRLFFFCLVIISSSHADAQTKITKYYDANWSETSKEKAAFYADFIKSGVNYNCTSYWINTNRVSGKSTFPDTVMANAIGLQVLYFKNGHIEDSGFVEDKKALYSFHYYANGRLAMHYYQPANSSEPVVEGYDEDGNKIKHYIFQKEAEFKGGTKAWQSYIAKSATKDLSVKGDSAITARVQVEFIIDENGDVTSSKIFKSSGYKNVDNDAMRVISESPKWNSAILYNQPVKAYRIQPIEYNLQPQKKIEIANVQTH